MSVKSARRKAPVVDEAFGRHDGRGGPQRWPRNRQRERVLQLIREHDGAMDAAELAAIMGLHMTTVRFHLDALCDDGAVARTRIKHAGVGRPRTGYVAVQGRLDYRGFAELLALEFGDTVAQRQQRALRAGQRWAERIVADDTTGGGPASGLDRGIAATTRIFERMGFAPELGARTGAEQTIRLHGCPVRDLARSHPEVTCGVHLGLLRGLLGGPAGAGPHAELEPFAEPELCLAKVICDD